MRILYQASASIQFLYYGGIQKLPGSGSYRISGRAEYMAEYISATSNLSASSGSSVIPDPTNTRYPASTISGVISLPQLSVLSSRSQCVAESTRGGWYVNLRIPGITPQPLIGRAYRMKMRHP